MREARVGTTPYWKVTFRSTRSYEIEYVSATANMVVRIEHTDGYTHYLTCAKLPGWGLDALWWLRELWRLRLISGIMFNYRVFRLRVLCLGRLLLGGGCLGGPTCNANEELPVPLALRSWQHSPCGVLRWRSSGKRDLVRDSLGK